MLRTAAAANPALTAVLLLLVCAVLAQLRRPAAAALHARNGRLVVRLGLFDTLFAGVHRVSLPVELVRSISVERRGHFRATAVRFPGTTVPGLVAAGRMQHGPQLELWNVRRAERVLVVELDPAADYRRLVLEVPDPTTQASRLRSLLAS